MGSQSSRLIRKVLRILELLASENREDVFFLLVGDGPAVPELKTQAKRLSFEKQFEATGLVKREEMPYWLDQMDIALQPAVTPWASPLKMIEYLAKGLAIVAPSSANIKELLCNNNSLLFQAT